MKTLKLLWSLDRTYTVLGIISLPFMLISLLSKNMGVYALWFMVLYVSFNEMRYKYDNKYEQKDF